MKIFKQQILRIVLTVFVFVLILASVLYTLAGMFEGKLNTVLNGQSYRTETISDEAASEIDSEYYKSSYSSFDEYYKHAVETAVRIEAEGAVLLKNEDSALPLAGNEKLSLFSRSTVDPVYGGSGAGAGAGGESVTLRGALEEEGFAVNGTLWDYYASQNGSGRSGFTAFELDPDGYPSSVTSSYSDYNDAAIIMLSRVGGEGSDLPMSGTAGFEGGDYLALETNERKMIEDVCAKFDKVIVLINSCNAMELGWLDEYDIDACLWIGAPGQFGFTAVAQILSGEVNPSGRLSSTYAADAQSSPAAVNNASYLYSNQNEIFARLQQSPDFSADSFWAMMMGSGAASSYLVEKEGIYIGYKYYETRYEDSVLGQGNASSSAGAFASSGSGWNYADEVVYPFGYGLSYTTFTQTLDSVEVTDEQVIVTVTVTNGGNVAGKDVVQVYGQVPYTEFDRQNGLEQASVSLVGVEKTGTIAAGQSQTVEIAIDKTEFTTYDYKVNKTYILEAGDYYVAIGSDAHDAANNILAAKGATGMTDHTGASVSGDGRKAYSFTQGSTDTRTYSTDYVTGNPITNLFDDADLNYYDEGSVTYLSRSNWQTTWPTEVTVLEASDEMIDTILPVYEAGSSDLSEITLGAENGLTLVMLMEEEYDSPVWDAFLDQLTIEDMVTIISRGGRDAVPAVGLNGGLMQDGPNGFNVSYADGTPCIYYPAMAVLGSTFSPDLAYEAGLCIGEDSLYADIYGWFGPGANLFRTPYSGRNFEYYSEDAYLTGVMAAEETEAAQSKGLMVIIKHFFLNDRETNRWGCSTFNNEQAIRQLYLKAFRGSFAAGAQGVMGAFNRIGCTWTNMSSAIMHDLLREEWGFEGIVTTDYYFGAYQDMRLMLEAGTTVPVTDMTFVYQISNMAGWAQQDAKLVENMREASHRMLYNMVNSNAMNGIDVNTRMVRVMPWYRVLLLTVTIVSAVVAAASGGLLVCSVIYDKKKAQKMTAEVKNES